MALDRAKRRQWTLKLEKLATDKENADENLLVGIADAVDAGVTQADIAYAVGGISPTGVKAKAEKGWAIKEARAKK